MKTKHYYEKTRGDNQYRKVLADGNYGGTYTYYPANRTMVLNR